MFFSCASLACASDELARPLACASDELALSLACASDQLDPAGKQLDQQSLELALPLACASDPSLIFAGKELDQQSFDRQSLIFRPARSGSIMKFHI